MKNKIASGLAFLVLLGGFLLLGRGRSVAQNFIPTHIISGGCTTTGNGQVCYDSAAGNWNFFSNGADQIVALAAGSGVFNTGDCALWLKSSSNVTVTDSGPCVLKGTTTSMGGGALAAGACSSGVSFISGAAVGNGVAITPSTYPGDGFTWEGYVPAGGIVTGKVCAIVAGTPAASVYNVRVFP